MPFKDKKERKKYMKKYMRDYRKMRSDARKQLLKDNKGLEQLRQRFPTAYEIIFGKPKPKKRQR